MYGRRMAYSADAIVVLGCRVHLSGVPTETAKRRAARAAQAYAEQIAPLILVSGGRRWGAHAEARVIAEELVRGGIPREALAEELCSLTTFENAIFSSAILRKLGAKRVALVTCAWHMERALHNFRNAGAPMDVWPLAASVPPPGIWQSLVRKGHEMVCKELDTQRMKRAQVLSGSAARLFEVDAGPRFYTQKPAKPHKGWDAIEEERA